MTRWTMVVAAAAAAIAAPIAGAVSMAPAGTSADCIRHRDATHTLRTRRGGKIVYCAKRKRDPLVAFRPRVQAFFGDVLPKVNEVGYNLPFGDATPDSHALQDGLLGLGRCSTTLASRLGAVPGVPAARSAAAQLAQLCGALADAAQQIGRARGNIVALAAAIDDLEQARDVARRVSGLLGLPDPVG